LVVGVSRACRCITFLCRPHVALRAGGQATKPEAGARMKPFELAISNNNIKYDTNNNNIDNNNNNYSAASLSAALLGFLAAERSVGATPMSPSDINFTDPRNIVSGLFSVVLLGAFVKNNFVDYNGPLASLLGMETGTCRVSHILVDTEEEAQRILAELTGGDAAVAKIPTLEEFASAAKLHSSCKSGRNGGSVDTEGLGTMVYSGTSNAGDLGLVHQGSTDQAFDDFCFDKLNRLGVPLGPVRTAFGYHLIWLVERTEK
ncbi:unnamed protein product, partial [Polarella glacialis]